MKNAKRLIFIFLSCIYLILSNDYVFRAEAMTSLDACTLPQNAASCTAAGIQAVARGGAGLGATEVTTGAGLTGLGGGLVWYADQNKGTFSWGGLSNSKATYIQNQVIGSQFMAALPEGVTSGKLYMISVGYNWTKGDGTLYENWTATKYSATANGSLDPMPTDHPAG
jgi:hypothetical protein